MRAPKHSSKFTAPYLEGKPAFSHRIYSRMAGVYIIKEDNVPVYVGYSKYNLYRTMYRHFETWTHRGQPVTTYSNKLNRNRYTVRVMITTPTEAPKWEQYLMNKLQPRDNIRRDRIEVYLSPEDEAEMQRIFKHQQQEPPF